MTVPVRDRVTAGDGHSSDDRLESWKEIAAFIGRDERTALRWAKQGMPVHHFPAGKRGRVFASREEISRWLRGQSKGQSRSEARPPAKGSRRWKWVVAVGLGSLALALSTALLFSHRVRRAASSQVTRATFTYNAVVAWSGNSQLWKHEFPHPVYTSFWGPSIRASDFIRILEPDPRSKAAVVIVAPLRMSSNPGSLYETVVDCFSGSGKLLWSYVPQEKFQFGKYTLQGPWYVTALYVSETDSNPSVWIAAEHYVWGNSFVAQLDLETGRATLRFVNTGILYALNEVKTSNGTQLLVGGFNNEYSAGILAVINEKKSFASSPQTPGSRHQCVNCAPGAPDEYFVFPRTEVNRVESVYQDPVTTIQVSGDQVHAYKAEALNLVGASTIYQFTADPTIRPTSLRYDSSYDMLYRRLGKEGRIHYSLASSPERLHPRPVSVWTPSRGWANCDFRPPGIASTRALPISRPPRYLLAATPQR